MQSSLSREERYGTGDRPCGKGGNAEPRWGSEARGFAALSLRTCPERAEGTVEGRCAAAVMKHSKYSVFSLYRKETKYATVRNEKLSEFSVLFAFSAVNDQFLILNS